jgi:hypothetical protein
MSSIRPNTNVIQEHRNAIALIQGVLRARFATVETKICVMEATRWSNETAQAHYLQHLRKFCVGVKEFNNYLVSVLNDEMTARQSDAPIALDTMMEDIEQEARLWENAWFAMLNAHQFDNDFSQGKVCLVHLASDEKRSEFPNSLAIAQGRASKRRSTKTPKSKARQATQKAAKTATQRALL